MGRRQQRSSKEKLDDGDKKRVQFHSAIKTWAVIPPL